MRSRARITKAEFFVNYDSDEKIEMIAAKVLNEAKNEDVYLTPPNYGDKKDNRS